MLVWLIWVSPKHTRRPRKRGNMSSLPQGPITPASYNTIRRYLRLTERKIWCDWGMRGRSHRLVITTSVGISSCNSVKSGGPTSISKHKPQQFHGWNHAESLVWSGHDTHTRHYCVNLLPWTKLESYPLKISINSRYMLSMLTASHTFTKGVGSPHVWPREPHTCSGA